LVREAIELPASAMLYRARWEVLRRLGWHRRTFRAAYRDPARVLELFPLATRSSQALLDYFRTRDRAAFFFSRDDLDVLRRLWRDRLPGAQVALIREADRLLRHEFDLLGRQVCFGAGPIDWHDAGDGKRWPLRHWSTIRAVGPGSPGDVRWTWELNRTQFLVTLARAYALTGEESYAREMCSLMRGWLEQNPPEIGVNWWSNLEVALRATSWMFAIEMTLGWHGWDPDLFLDVVRNLLEHQRHLRQGLDFSERWMGGNHLVGDAMGLALLGMYLPEAPGSARTRDEALDILARESAAQILPDGGFRENAIGYHRSAFYMFLLPALLRERNGGGFTDDLRGRLDRMADFALRLRTPSGHLSQIGDWDDGRTVVLDDSRLEDLRSLLCTAAVAFRQPRYKAAGGEFREEVLWLLGPDAARVYAELPARSDPAPDSHHAESGVCVWRSGWQPSSEFVLFKAAPFNPHTHADNLEVLLSTRGQDWLVDRGTYAYGLHGTNRRWRDYFRGTRAHNCVVVDGEGQAIPHRAFRWLAAPRQRLEACHADAGFGFALGSTTGFQRLRSPVTHVRGVLLARGRYLLVVDLLRGSGEHLFEVLWHLAPGLQVAVTGPARAVARGGGPFGLRLDAVATSGLNVRVAEGEQDPIQGWHSPSYGVRVPAPTVIYAIRGEVPITIATLLAVGTGEEVSASVLLQPGPAGRWGAVRLVVTDGVDEDRILLADPVLPGDADPANFWIRVEGRGRSLTVSRASSGRSGP
jgi:hypothetical protein